jgi:hypothetical protein
MRMRLILAGIAAAAVVGVIPPTTSAATPCWKKVISDWSAHNGVIQGHYSPHCLRQAIKNMHEDLRDYTSIIDDISALLADAGGTGGDGSGGSGGSGANRSMSDQSRMERADAARARTQRMNDAVPDAGSSASAPGRSRPLPLPLLILGSIAVAAVLASAAPPVIKRVRGRFPRFRPAAESVRPPS